jgi:hypothetical protein
MAGRATPPQGRKLGNINTMPNRRYLPSINFSVPFARWSHFYDSIDWTNETFSCNFGLMMQKFHEQLNFIVETLVRDMKH